MRSGCDGFGQVQQKNTQRGSPWRRHAFLGKRPAPAKRSLEVYEKSSMNR
jgi:hypothetical protein